VAQAVEDLQLEAAEQKALLASVEASVALKEVAMGRELEEMRMEVERERGQSRGIAKGMVQDRSLATYERKKALEASEQVRTKAKREPNVRF
jgi:5-bromo-4-chloroindolyl phosphate hydrolysis protein